VDGFRVRRRRDGLFLQRAPVRGDGPAAGRSIEGPRGDGKPRAEKSMRHGASWIRVRAL
jgi:hypothetical protein